MNEQENFWKDEYASDYLKKNNSFDRSLGIDCWSQMLSKTKGIETILECGSNLGRNIDFLDEVLPKASKSIIEISPKAYEIVTSRYNLSSSFNGTILNSSFEENSFDLVYTIGVLIHIHPDELMQNMTKMFSYSKQYILMGEYFNRTPVSIEYQGKMNTLFKRDFGKLFIENFPVNLVDYGFLWGHLYDTAGFDDITYWVFEKQ
jgi:pseudaminic acid biosynthesis-associated methylase